MIRKLPAIFVVLIAVQSVNAAELSDFVGKWTASQSNTVFEVLECDPHHVSNDTNIDADSRKIYTELCQYTNGANNGICAKVISSDKAELVGMPFLCASSFQSNQCNTHVVKGGVRGTRWPITGTTTNIIFLDPVQSGSTQAVGCFDKDNDKAVIKPDGCPNFDATYVFQDLCRKFIWKKQ